MFNSIFCNNTNFPSKNELSGGNVGFRIADCGGPMTDD
jgi:hypothetical protein